MTRRPGTSRTTQSQQPSAAASPRNAYPSLRERNPVAYWLAILGVAALVLSTVATALGALL
jgi:hypothetical protein